MTLHTIMTADETGSQLVDFARAKAIELVKQNLTRAQIRNIFTEVRQIEAIWGHRPEEAMRRLNMLKPKLAYQTARTPALSPLKDTLTEAINEVEKAQGQKREDAFERFMDLFEAILAYHRAEGGRN
jgi:CRISPR-associated protein Csm2